MTRLLLTPGPTTVPERVRTRMAEPTINADVDPAFDDLYESVTDMLARVYGTDDEVVVLGGEGILGLEAAVASVVSAGDRVLCVANGIYGEGFADFVELYGGRPEVVGAAHDAPLDVEGVRAALETGEFAAATMVHCETPTGALNDIEPVLSACADADVLTVVDAVSSLGGVPVPTDAADIVIGGSQKCFSSPPGLATLSVSDAAWDVIDATDVRSFYANLGPWKGHPRDGELFPYTHLSANVAALEESLSLLLEEGLSSVYRRHAEVAEYCRGRAADLGLECYPGVDRSSPTVTALSVEGRAREYQQRLADEHDVVLATGLGDREEDVLRVGHMGANATLDRVERAMDALAAVLKG